MTKEIDRSKLKLDLPSLDVFDSYIEALREDYVQGSQPTAREEEIQSYVADPQAYIDSLLKDKGGVFATPDGTEFQRVPDEQLWLSVDGEFIGSVSFRLELSDFLKEYGGHIGYGIRPKYQGQGFATLALEMTKERAKQKGLSRLFLTCSEDNPASEKVIVKCGGVHQDTIGDIYGFKGPTKRFWIHL